MSLGTTLLSGAVDALDALVRKTLVVLERRVEHCSFDGLDEVGMQLLCAMTLIAGILDRWIALVLTYVDQMAYALWANR
jgi:hypothetical protein